METPYKIFIVEDNPWYGEILQYHLSLNPDYEVMRFLNGAELMSNLHLQPDLITMDYYLPDYSGENLYQKIRAVNDQVPVIVISGQEDIGVAVKLLKMGVTDYFVKDDNTKDLLWNAIGKIQKMVRLKNEVAQLKEELSKKYVFDKSIKGQSPALKNVFAQIEKAAKTNINISITGETGTGKELAAKAIHYNSNRNNKTFVAVNMAAIPKDLMESELFGHEKGAFTGAVSRKIGKFEEANGGTIFLDEISELDISTQSKLLRVLQEREIVRVGGNELIKLNIRLITATHQNLNEKIKEGKFREDLFYRISGFPINMPPLRERGADILVLAKYFAEHFTHENNLPQVSLSKEANDKLMGYPFPGNVRELKSMIELACVLCNGSAIKAGDIMFNQPIHENLMLNGDKSLKQYEIDIISFYLKKYNNEVLTVAQKLNIGKSKIYTMIKNNEIIL